MRAAEITIERLALADVGDAADLLHAQLLEHRISSDRDTARRSLAGLVEVGSRGFVLVARGTDAVGLAVLAFAWTVEHGGNVAWLDELYVVPRLRGLGVGRALLLRAIAECEREGCVAMDLEVDREHGRAANLYTREGFEPLGRARYARRLTPRPTPP